jgi:phenylpyruvate tautomerase PptA (4-oxalocrotonate tautomerase family)
VDHPPEVCTAREEEERMPIIEARLLEGVFSSDEREQLAEGLINAVVGVKGESFRSETEVLIAEVPVALAGNAVAIGVESIGIVPNRLEVGIGNLRAVDVVRSV